MAKKKRNTTAKKKMNTMDTVAMLLVVIGALNWGLVGLLNMDLVKLLLGSMPALQQIVYILVGLSGLWMLYKAFM